MSAATDLISGILTDIFTSPQAATDYSENPEEYLTAAGVNEVDFSGINMGETVAQVANDLAMDNDVTTTLIEVSEPVPAGPVLEPLAPASTPAPASAGASSGGGSSAPAAGSSGGGSSAPAPAPITTLEQVQQVVNNYTTVVYEGDETITNNLFDNSQNLELDLEGVEGDVDLEIDLDAVNANGPGAVAAGRDIEDSNIASGEGAVAFDGANQGVVNTGTNTGVIADGNVDDTIIGDNNTQVGQADTVVSGDGNTVTQVDGSDNVVQVGDGNENTQVDTGGGDATVIDAEGDVDNTDIDASGGADVNSISGDGNVAVQGEGNTAGFGDGDVVDFGEDNEFDDAQIGIGGSTVQDNDIEDSFNTAIDQDTTTVVDVDDNSINDSFNTDIEDSFDTEDSFNAEVETTIEDSFDTEESFNTAEEFQADVAVEATDSVVDVDDVLDD